MLFGMTYYQICWYFLIYSFGGWIVEVIFHAVSLGKVINRGFLNGPVCPIYGFGVLSVFAMINSFELNGMPMNDFWVFIFGVVLSTLVELIGGWLLDKCFHARWWDYTGRPFNFHGYICLEFSIIWGLAILFVVRIFQKYLENQPSFFQESTFGWIMVGIMLFIYLADFIVTVSIIQGFNKELKKLDDIRGEMRIVSDKLSEVVGVQTMKTATRIGEERVQINLAKAELRDIVELKKEETEEELYEKQKQLKRRFDEISTKLTANSLWGSGRLLKAFPDMKHIEHNVKESVDRQKDIVREAAEKARQEAKRAMAVGASSPADQTSDTPDETVEAAEGVIDRLSKLSPEQIAAVLKTIDSFEQTGTTADSSTINELESTNAGKHADE